MSIFKLCAYYLLSLCSISYTDLQFSLVFQSNPRCVIPISRHYNITTIVRFVSVVIIIINIIMIHIKFITTSLHIFIITRLSSAFQTFQTIIFITIKNQININEKIIVNTIVILSLLPLWKKQFQLKVCDCSSSQRIDKVFKNECIARQNSLTA